MQKHLDDNKEAPKQKRSVKKVRARLRKHYKKFMSRIKRYRGVTSIVISVKGELYDTSLENTDIADYINYKFGALAMRARRDVRDIDPLDDIKCIRIVTLFYEAIIGLGGRLDREFMIFVTQKTPDSIQRPIKKPKMCGVYLKQTDPIKQRRKRKNPVKDLQRKLFGITTEAAKQQIQMQQLNETRAVKMAEMETNRKHQKRLQNLTALTEKALASVSQLKPVHRDIIKPDKRRTKFISAMEPLPELPLREQVFDLGYYRPRHSRRISIYDEEGYKVRGDVKIGFKPQEDEGLFPLSRATRRQYRPRGVFQRKRDSGDEQKEATPQVEATPKPVPKQTEEDEESVMDV